MIRMTKQTDYGFVLLSRLAAAPTAVLAAPELAEETRLPLPMVSKILKLLARHGLLASHRGVKGGYSLALRAADITAADILRALEGPVALTVCIEGSPGECDREPYCEVRRHWQAINEAVDGALGRITLEDLARPAVAGLVRIGAGREPGARTEARVATT